jgi:hypothetical protein
MMNALSRFAVELVERNPAPALQSTGKGDLERDKRDAYLAAKIPWVWKGTPRARAPICYYFLVAVFFLGTFLPFFASFRKADRDGLLAALHRAAFPAFFSDPLYPGASHIGAGSTSLSWTGLA